MSRLSCHVPSLSPVVGVRSGTDAPSSTAIQFTPSCKTETMTRMMSTTAQNKLK
jgi:hypothetical protein